MSSSKAGAYFIAFTVLTLIGFRYLWAQLGDSGINLKQLAGVMQDPMGYMESGGDFEPGNENFGFDGDNTVWLKYKGYEIYADAESGTILIGKDDKWFKLDGAGKFTGDGIEFDASGLVGAALKAAEPDGDFPELSGVLDVLREGGSIDALKEYIE